jgi:hypothetical protein
LVGGGQEIESQPGRADVIGFLDDESPPLVQPARGSGKDEGQQQAHQTEIGAVDQPVVTHIRIRVRSRISRRCPAVGTMITSNSRRRSNSYLAR